MSDCVNVEMRELLPDLLHEELSDGRRAQVESHVASCPSCAEELALLREAQAALRAMYEPRIDTAAIVAALPKPGRDALRGKGGVGVRSRAPWRVAAAIAAVALGGLAYSVGRSPVAPTIVAGGDSTPAAAVTDTPRVRVAPSETTLASAESVGRGGTRGTDAAHGLLAAGGVGDLDDSALQALLGDLERIEAVPVAEPEALSGNRLVNGGTTGTEE